MMNPAGHVGGKSIDNSSLARDLVFVEELNLVFCFISKNASSFLKAYIASLAHGTSFDWRHNNPHVLRNSKFSSLAEMSVSDSTSLLRSADVVRAVVGRDPLNRFQSAYMTRILTFQREVYDSHDRSSWLKLRQKILAQSYQAHAVPDELAMIEAISIDDVAEYVSRTPAGLLDQHLTPQTYFSSVDSISYNLVGNVEDMDSFLKELCRLVDREPLKSEPPKLNRLVSSNENVELSPAHRGLLLERYKMDYEYFNYPQP